MMEFNFDDYSSLSESFLVGLIAKAKQSKSHIELEAAAQAMKELRRRRGDYVLRVCRKIGKHLASPLSVNDLLPSIFFNVMEQADTFHPPINILGATRQRQIFCHWVNGIICNTHLIESNDKQLMAQMARRGEDASTAKIAKKALWEIERRHGESVLKYCLYLVRGNFDAGMARDLLHDTFVKIYDKAGTYKGDGIDDPKELSRLTRGWIKRIAHNLYIDMVRQQLVADKLIDFERDEAIEALRWRIEAALVLMSDAEEAKQMNETDDAGATREMHIECMSNALNEVATVRERDILMVTAMEYFTEKKRRDALRAVEDAYRITSDNRRHITKRARVKLENHTAAHCAVCRQRVLQSRKKAPRRKPPAPPPADGD